MAGIEDKKEKFLLKIFLNLKRLSFRISFFKKIMNKMILKCPLLFSFVWLCQGVWAEPMTIIDLPRNGSDIDVVGVHQSFENGGEGSLEALHVLHGSNGSLDGRPIPHYLSERGRLQALKEFLNHHIVDINKGDSSLNTALHYAAWKSPNTELIEFLLSKGADPNAENKKGETPLHWAAKNIHNSEAVIQALLRAKADPTKKTTTGENVLHYMAKYNQSPKAFKALLPYKDQLVVGDNEGNFPLHSWMAKGSDNLAVLKALLQFHPDFLNIRNHRGETAVHLGMKNGKLLKKIEAVKIFQDAGADFNAKDQEGNTPAHWLAQNKDLTAPFLLAVFSTEADPEAKNAKGETPLHLAAKYNEQAAVIMAFGNREVDFHARDKEGNRPAHLAAAGNRNPEVLRALFLFNGEDIDVRNNKMETPAHLAAEFNTNSKVIDFLYEQGADFNLKDERGRTVLHRMSKANEHVLKEILESKPKGLQINVQDIDGETALHYAIKKRFRPKVLEAFVLAGADLDIENNKGETPRSLLNDLSLELEIEVRRHPPMNPCLETVRSLISRT